VTPTQRTMLTLLSRRQLSGSHGGFVEHVGAKPDTYSLTEWQRDQLNVVWRENGGKERKDERAG
jgi:hypothetical protein